MEISDELRGRDGVGLRDEDLHNCMQLITNLKTEFGFHFKM